jgi:hypothetical protein
VTNVTGAEVRDAAIAAKIKRVAHHRCGGCGVMVHYLIVDQMLFFDPSCDCTRAFRPELREWSDAANWINMQSDPKHRVEIANSFGLDLSAGSQADAGDAWCDVCHNTGSVECYCGGDLCVCENQGEIDCPECRR